MKHPVTFNYHKLVTPFQLKYIHVHFTLACYAQNVTVVLLDTLIIQYLVAVKYILPPWICLWTG